MIGRNKHTRGECFGSKHCKRSVMADSSEESDIDEVINLDFNEIMQDDTGPDLNDILNDISVMLWKALPQHSTVNYELCLDLRLYCSVNLYTHHQVMIIWFLKTL